MALDAVSGTLDSHWFSVFGCVTERPDRPLYKIGDPAYDANHVVASVDLETAARLLTPAVREFAVR